MAEIIRMPKLSDTMTEGVVAEWHKKIGDNVKSGELLADIETDKATMEFESFQEGTLLYIGVEKGKTAPVDSILAIVGKKGEDVSALVESEKKKPAPAAEVSAPAATPAAEPKKEEPAKAAPVAAPVVQSPPLMLLLLLLQKSAMTGVLKYLRWQKKLPETKTLTSHSSVEQVMGAGL